MKYFCSNSILLDAQHGFMKSRSCEAQLATLVSEIATHFNDGGQLDVALLDRKVFDKVNHRNLS